MVLKGTLLLKKCNRRPLDKFCGGGTSKLRKVSRLQFIYVLMLCILVMLEGYKVLSDQSLDSSLIECEWAKTKGSFSVAISCAGLIHPYTMLQNRIDEIIGLLHCYMARTDRWYASTKFQVKRLKWDIRPARNWQTKWILKRFSLGCSRSEVSILFVSPLRRHSTLLYQTISTSAGSTTAGDSIEWLQPAEYFNHTLCVFKVAGWMKPWTLYCAGETLSHCPEENEQSFRTGEGFFLRLCLLLLLILAN